MIFTIFNLIFPSFKGLFKDFPDLNPKFSNFSTFLNSKICKFTNFIRIFTVSNDFIPNFNWIGDCIWESWVCDGESDCAQAEDEENCHGGADGSSSDCPEYRCLRSGGCVPYAAVCNGHQDCADNTDEEGCGLIVPTNSSSTSTTIECPKGSFRCDGSMCLPLRLYCNNQTDCYDNSDESNCSPDKRVYQVIKLGI